MADLTSNSPNCSDLLNALSLILAVENLKQNEAQSQYNDVHSANDEQAELLLEKINKRFAEQDETINEILKICKENNAILSVMLKENSKRL